jgi:uptake hydrogenase small subunit
MVNLVWLQGSTDNGCLVSFLNTQQPDVYQLITKLDVNIEYQNTINPTSGRDALAAVEKYYSGERELDVLVVEGAVPRGPDGTGMACFIGARPFKDIVLDLSKVSKYTVAVGTCATFGGIPAAPPNPTDATGLQFHKDKIGGFLGADYRSKAGLPVVNISGCPAHPDWLVQTLAAVLLGKDISLDEYNRPKDFYGEHVTVHDGCTRNEYYTSKVSAEKFGDRGCLYMFMGCAGPYTRSDCNKRLWNRQGSLTRAGIPCHGCTNPDFPEGLMPFFFYRRMPATGWKKVPYLIGSAFAKMAKEPRLKNE